jgi:hypothetical protein
MPTLGITWANKESGGQPKTVHIQQWWWEDANEVKNAINAHKTLLDGGVIGNPLRAESFVKTGGTDSQVLLADGTVQEKSTLAPDRNLQEITDIGNSTSNSIEAFSFIKTGGLSVDILLADGTTIKTNKVGKFVDGTDTNDAVYTAGKVGAGLTTPTAKIHAKASTAGEPLLKLETFGGATTLQADDNGSVWNSGISGNGENTFFGVGAGLNVTTALKNTFIGTSAGANSTNGNNTFIGFQSGISNNTGSSNVFTGTFAGRLNTSGGGNSYYGRDSGYSGTTGGFNVAFGLSSLRNNILGSGNVAMGVQAGFQDNLLNDLTDISNSVFIGFNTKALAVGDENEIVIGSAVVGNGSNTATIGNKDITDLYVGGDGAGINLKSPDGTTWRLTVDNTGNLNIAA